MHAAPCRTTAVFSLDLFISTQLPFFFFLKQKNGYELNGFTVKNLLSRFFTLAHSGSFREACVLGSV